MFNLLNLRSSKRSFDVYITWSSFNIPVPPTQTGRYRDINSWSNDANSFRWSKANLPDFNPLWVARRYFNYFFIILLSKWFRVTIFRYIIVYLFLKKNRLHLNYKYIGTYIIYVKVKDQYLVNFTTNIRSRLAYVRNIC